MGWTRAAGRGIGRWNRGIGAQFRPDGLFRQRCWEARGRLEGDHPYARLVILTKSADDENLLDLDHADRTILSWTVNAPEVAQRFERNTPDVSARIEAMRRCAQAGYPVRAVVMPIIPAADWQETYGRFMERLLATVPLSRISLGSICSYPQAQRLMELKLGKQNAISALFDRGPAQSDDGRLRFGRAVREEIYRYLIGCIRRQRPDLEIGLCLEDEPMFASLDLTGSMGRCNCVL